MGIKVEEIIEDFETKSEVRIEVEEIMKDLKTKSEAGIKVEEIMKDFETEFHHYVEEKVNKSNNKNKLALKDKLKEEISKVIENNSPKDKNLALGPIAAEGLKAGFKKVCIAKLNKLGTNIHWELTEVVVSTVLNQDPTPEVNSETRSTPNTKPETESTIYATTPTTFNGNVETSNQNSFSQSKEATTPRTIFFNSGMSLSFEPISKDVKKLTRLYALVENQVNKFIIKELGRNNPFGDDLFSSIKKKLNEELKKKITLRKALKLDKEEIKKLKRELQEFCIDEIKKKAIHAT